MRKERGRNGKGRKGAILCIVVLVSWTPLHRHSTDAFPAHQVLFERIMGRFTQRGHRRGFFPLRRAGKARTGGDSVLVAKESLSFIVYRSKPCVLLFCCFWWEWPSAPHFVASTIFVWPLNKVNVVLPFLSTPTRQSCKKPSTVPKNHHT